MHTVSRHKTNILQATHRLLLVQGFQYALSGIKQFLKIDIQLFLMMVKNYRDDRGSLLEDI